MEPNTQSEARRDPSPAELLANAAMQPLYDFAHAGGWLREKDLGPLHRVVRAYLEDAARHRGPR